MAATKECPFCYTDIDSRATVCPNCHKDLRVKRTAYHVGSFIMAAALFAIFGGIFIDPTIIVLGGIVLLVGWVIRRNL